MARGALNVQEAIVDAVLTDDEDSATAPVVEVDEDDFLPAENMSIMVPESVCKIIKQNIDDARKVYAVDYDKWDEAFVEYRKSNKEHGLDGQHIDDYRFFLANDTDENIVRANVRLLMRTTYMQNPYIEFTGEGEDKAFADSLEYILKFIMNKESHPGLNMKPVARRWILHGHLTNFGVVRLDYQAKEGSQEDAVNLVKEWEEKLSKAKSKKEAYEIMAKLEFAYNELPAANPKGMTLTNVLPHCVVSDPFGTKIDLSDSRWIAEYDDEDQEYIKAKYYKKNDDDEWVLRANPNITVNDPCATTDNADTDVRDDVLDTVIGHASDEFNNLRKKGTIRIWRYYDKILRRIYVFNDNDWKHPLWCGEDDLGLSRFFRHFIMAFGEPVETLVQPGEVSYYIGQTYEINKINRKIVNIRDNVFNNVAYNAGEVDVKEVNKLIAAMQNPGKVAAFGVSGKSEKPLSQILEVVAPPAVQYEKLFDTTNLRSAIDRYSATSAVDRGEQFKTNTTNDAIQYQAQVKQETTGVAVTIIEECLESLAWSICEILVSKYSPEEIAEMVGEKHAQAFKSMTVAEFNQKFRMKLAAGSIEKPTTEFKKKEALNVAQALGQIGQAAPGATLSVILKMFQTSFQTAIDQDVWDMLKQEAQANITKGQSTNGPQEPARPAAVSA